MSEAPALVMRGGFGLPYSRSLMGQSLMAAGVEPAEALGLAALVEERLPGRRVEAEALRELAEAVLAEHAGPEQAQRYRHWRAASTLRRPLAVLIGGTAGTGKSTVATALAARLGITRLTSTDMIRHVLRTCFAPEVMPDVHVSSFEAGSVAGALVDEPESAELVGFRVQAEHVGAAVRAILHRAVAEGTPLLLEGVHLVPGSVPAELAERALLVHVVLAVSDEQAHRGHFEARAEAEGRGPVSRYLERLDTIRALQEHLVARAAACGVPVVENRSVDAAVEAVMGHVQRAVAAAVA